MNRQSNTYTVIYAIVLVLIVGVALSVVYQSLRPRQEENISNDTKRQILAAALIVPSEGETVSQLYERHIKESFVVNSEGIKVADAPSAFDINVAEEVKKEPEKRLLPVYICETEAGIKYIIPVAGNGLWGPIWGYVALDSNGDTIYGAYFAHQGETPGLGAEIEKPQFQNQFQGKNILGQNGAFKGVAVVKNGQEPQEGSYVHAISGGTITSQGVQKMLENSLSPYTSFFDNLHSSSTVSSEKETNTVQK